MVRLNNLILLFILVWCGGWSQFIPLTIRSIIGIFIGFLGFSYAICKWQKNFSKQDLIILMLAVIFPIIASFRANQIWDQPLYVGLLSLRNFLNILFVYYLLKAFKANIILDILCKYQLLIMVLDTVLLYLFNLDNNRVLSFLPSDENAAFVKGEAAENELRGLRLSLGAGFTWLTMSIWSAKYYIKRNKKDLLCMLVTVLFVFFVSKSRVSLLICFFIAIMPLLFDRSFTNKLKLLLILSLALIIAISIPAISSRFLVLFDLFGDTRTQGTGDFSGVARLSEILVAIPYIIKYPILGVGNISYHYNDGFNGVLGEYFFLADIGIVGMLFMGGIFLCMLYYMMFISAQRINCRRCNDKIINLMIKLITTVYMIVPFMGSFPLLGDTTYIGFILYLSLTNTFKSNVEYIYR